MIHSSIFVQVLGIVLHFQLANGGDLSSTIGETTAEAIMMIRSDGELLSASFLDEQPNSGETDIKQERHEQDKPIECGLWLAPSAIEGAGLGMFAGRHFDKDEEFQVPGDIVIPIVDYRLHLGDLVDQDTFLWDDYTWSADVGLPMNGDTWSHVDLASPGFGSAANSFLPLQNVEEWNPKSLQGQTAKPMHRSSDPGVGAFTIYGDRRSTATRAIEQGEELYVSYGEKWFVTRERLGAIPLFDDLNKGDALVAQYKALVNQTSSKVPKEILDSVWDVFVRNTRFNLSRVIGGFRHSDPDELDELIQTGKTLTKLRQEQATRSVEWLQEHGTCADHITPKPSTIAQAGHGAFSTRFLPKDTILAQIPLIHIVDRSVLNMYKFEPGMYNEGQPVPNPDLGISGQQLLVNYCYGHGESTLLLCGYGPIVNYINHNQTLANVRIQWSDAARGNHMPNLLLHDLESLKESGPSAKLAFDVMVLRDIEEGEEIFLDYGDAWEAAWRAHVENWMPLPRSKRYKSAAELIDDVESRIPTVFKTFKNPNLYRPEVDLWCNNLFVRDDWKEPHANGTLDDYLSEAGGVIYRCDVLRAKPDGNDNWLYTAVMWHEEEYGSGSLEYIDVINDVPRDAFTWGDRPYMNDMFVSNAFRHSIGIPDEIFPARWRNLAR